MENTILPNGIVIAKPDYKRLDAKTRNDLIAEMAGFIKEERRIAMDLFAIEFIDSSGLGGLLSILRSLSEGGGDLRLAAPSTVVESLFRITRMNRVFEVFKTIDEAVGSYLK